MIFTADEISIIKIYYNNNSEKNSLIKEMRDSLPLVEDPEVSKIMESAIKKVCSLDDAAYDNLDFSQALVCDDTDETENQSYNVKKLLKYFKLLCTIIMTIGFPISGLTPKIRNSCRTNVPVVGRQQKNLCFCRTNVPVAGGQQKNQSPKGSMEH